MCAVCSHVDSKFLELQASTSPRSCLDQHISSQQQKSNEYIELCSTFCILSQRKHKVTYVNMGQKSIKLQSIHIKHPTLWKPLFWVVLLYMYNYCCPKSVLLHFIKFLSMNWFLFHQKKKNLWKSQVLYVYKQVKIRSLGHTLCDIQVLLRLGVVMGWQTH